VIQSEKVQDLIIVRIEPAVFVIYRAFILNFSRFYDNKKYFCRDKKLIVITMDDDYHSEC
jgi:hypothetical protein